MVVMALALVAALTASIVYLRPSLGSLSAGAGTPTPSPAGDQLGPVSVADANHGVIQYLSASDGRLGSSYVTSDGGRTWSVLHIPNDSSETFSVTIQPGGALLAEEVSPGPGHFLRSLDWGRSWQPLSDPRISTTDSNGPVFLDRRAGWWLERPLPPPNPPSGQSTGLWHTLDGGQTWAWLPSSGIPSLGVSSQLLFLDSSHAILTLTRPYNLDVLVTTGDGGATWQPVAGFEPPVAHLRSTKLLLLRHGARLVAWLTAFASGPASAPLAFSSTSDDGGRTWAELREGPPVFSGPAAIDNRGRLLVLADRRLLTSDDDGVTWTARVIDAPPGRTPLTMASAAPGALYATAVSASALEPLPRNPIESLLRSSDGGIHWTEVQLPAVARF